MKKIFLLATTATLLLFSCSKEKSIDTTDPDGPGGGGGGNSSGLLVKTAIQLGQNDSSITNYAYDAQNRLVRLWLSGNQNVMSDPGEIIIVRNSQGAIQSFTVNDAPGSSENMVYTVYYDGGSGRYTAKVSTEDVSGTLYRDSLVYNYNGAGQISEEIYYVSIDGSPYADWAKNEFIYNGSGNLTEYKGYFLDVNTINYVQASHILVEYDNKTNPLVLGAEGILLDQINFVSPNNVTKATVTDLEDPSNNEVATYAYVYNDKNKPATATITFQSVGLPIPITFYYQ